MTRLIVGLLYGLIFGGMVWYYWHSIYSIYAFIINGFVFGVAAGIHDWTYLASDRTASSRRPRLRIIGAVGVALFAAFPVGLFLMAALGLLDAATAGQQDPRLMHVTVNAVVIFVFLPTMALLWGLRISRRSLSSDIQSVEALSWSWKPLAWMFVPPVFLSSLVILADGVRFGAETA